MTIEERIAQRIAELEAEKLDFEVNANHEFQKRITGYVAAIAELRAILTPPLPPNPLPEPAALLAAPSDDVTPLIENRKGKK